MARPMPVLSVGDDRMLTTQEVAQMLGVSQDTVYAYLRKGLSSPSGTVRLRHVRLGQYRIPESAVQEFLQALSPDAQVEVASGEQRRRKEAEAAGRRVRKRLGLE